MLPLFLNKERGMFLFPEYLWEETKKLVTVSLMWQGQVSEVKGISFLLCNIPCYLEILIL